jgi:hypothetical protein
MRCVRCIPSRSCGQLLELVKTLAFFNLQLGSSLLSEEAEILAKRYGVKSVVTDDDKSKIQHWI